MRKLENYSTEKLASIALLITFMTILMGITSILLENQS